MRSMLLTLILSAWSVLGLAHGTGQLADVAIIDRDTGQRLPMHYWRGEYWVAGESGARYAIYVHNQLAERLLTVTSVDGVNAVTGETASWNQNGYVLDSYMDYQITGWRKSDSIIAAFAFTAPPNSYAERTGRPENIGVIGVALFRERRAEAPPIAWSGTIAGGLAAAPRQAEGGRSASAAPFRGDVVNRPEMPALPAPALGTAHGEQEVSYVGHTTFVRLHADPDELIRIRYDSRENLIAMGIIRPSRSYPAHIPNPFPGAPGYVPDPPPG
jgi:hypothetical protein